MSNPDRIRKTKTATKERKAKENRNDMRPKVLSFALSGVFVFRPLALFRFSAFGLVSFFGL
jgi:hypothetical protein